MLQKPMVLATECPNCEKYQIEIVRLRAVIEESQLQDDKSCWRLSKYQLAAIDIAKAHLSRQQIESIAHAHISCLRAALIRGLVEFLEHEYANVCELSNITPQQITQAKVPKRVKSKIPDYGTKLRDFIELARSTVARNTDPDKLNGRLFRIYLQLAGSFFTELLLSMEYWPKTIDDIIPLGDLEDILLLIQYGWSPDDEGLAFAELSRRKSAPVSESNMDRWKNLVNQFGLGLLIAFYLGDKENAESWQS